MNCPICNHPSHEGHRCDYAITETSRDDVGIFAKPSGHLDNGDRRDMRVRFRHNMAALARHTDTTGSSGMTPVSFTMSASPDVTTYGRTLRTPSAPTAEQRGVSRRQARSACSVQPNSAGASPAHRTTCVPLDEMADTTTS